MDLSSFNTLNVTNFESVFSQCNGLKEIKGIEKFNAIKVLIMRGMLEERNEIHSLDLSYFDTSRVRVINMSLMFKKCRKLKEINGLKNFNTFNVTKMIKMFQDYND